MTALSERKSRNANPKARVTSVSQVLLTLQSRELSETFSGVRKQALSWLANRAGRPLPRHAWDGESFDMLEAGAQPVSALSDENLWFFRISDADKHVPQRSWTTECGVMLHSDRVLFGCRLQCVALAESPPFAATIPGVVRQVAENHGAFLDSRKILPRAWAVNSEDDVEDLVTLILDARRTRPVIVVSLGNMDGTDGPGIIDADALAVRTLGAAHVVTVTSDASFALTRRIGKEFSVFHRAIRTYQTRLDLDEDAWSAHPLALPSTVESWGQKGAEDFFSFLVEQALRATVSGPHIFSQLPSFAEVHSHILQARREKASNQGAPDDELLALALEENDSLRQKLSEEKNTYSGLLGAAETERKQAEVERDELLVEVRSLRARVMHIESALTADGKSEDTPIPESFDELEEWCNTYLAGSVWVHSRALRIARKSKFENPAIAYKALLILRDWFVPMKRDGGLDKKQGYEMALAELGLEDAPSFTAERVGEQGDEYKVNVHGQIRYLERHIKGSSSRQQRFGFRLYFCWAEDIQQVVVGAFPAHLNTRST